MMDLVVRTPRAPKKGETVIGASFQRFPGGKGANQAVAAARLGAKVTMAGKVGQDVFGDQMVATLREEGVCTEHVLRDAGSPTGIGSITLDDEGNNRIVVVPGANLNYNLDDLSTLRPLLASQDLLMLQLEMNIDTIKMAVEMASRAEVPIVLNPAPAQTISDDLLKAITYLTPNETEAELLTGVPVTDVESAKRAARVLLDRGPKSVIITLGEKGALLAHGDSFIHVPGYSVKPVDTVAAGDAFNGALAARVAGGSSLKDAVRYANAVGALTVTRQGAIPSLPTAKEVEEFRRATEIA